MIMKKNICLFSILLMATSAKAQLIVNDDQKVAMGVYQRDGAFVIMGDELNED